MLLDKIREINFGRIYLNISFVTLFFGLIFPYTGLIDRIFLILFITLAIVFKKTITNSDNFSTFALLYLTIAVSFSLSLDKVNNYPDGEYVELKLLLYLFLFCLHFPIIKRIFRVGTRIISIVALLVIYSPFLRLPMDFTRQVVGNVFISSDETIYFTKIHNNIIYGVNVDDTTHPVLFVPTSDGYVEKSTYSFPWGGSMDKQTIDETLTFKLLKWLDTKGQ